MCHSATVTYQKGVSQPPVFCFNLACPCNALFSISQSDRKEARGHISLASVMVNGALSFFEIYFWGRYLGRPLRCYLGRPPPGLECLGPTSAPGVSFLLAHNGGGKWRLKELGPYHPHRRARLSPQLLVQPGPGLAVVDIQGVNQWMRALCLSFKHNK